MKKKILATLLAVCLFVGIAIPAVMADFTSSQAGDPAKVESIKFTKASYEIKQDENINFLEETLVFESNKKLILDMNQISFSLEGADTAFAIDGAVVTAVENSGVAYVVAKDDATGKVVSKVKVVAVKNPAKRDVIATSFKFLNAKNDVLVDVDGVAATTAATIKVAPLPAGAKFGENEAAVVSAVETALGGALNGLNAYTFSGYDKDGNMIFEADGAQIITADDLKAFTTDDKKVTVEVGMEKDGSLVKNVKATTTLNPVKTKAYETIAIISNKTIEVGQKFDFADVVKKGAANANVNGGVTYSIDFASDDAEADDYAAIDGSKVLGVAVGKTKVIATLENGKTAECIVTVVPAGSIKTTPDGKVEAAAKELAIGGTTTVKVTGAAEGAKITWKVSDSKIAQIAPFEGAETKVYAKSAGTVKVTAMVDGVEIGSVEIVVKAATVDNNGGATSNPQTGDSLFANLF